MARAAFAAILVAMLVAACAAQTSPIPSVAPSASSAVRTPPPSSSAAPLVNPSEPAESAVPASIPADSMVVTLVNDLRVREEARLDAAHVGTLPAGEVAFVVDGPVMADGHSWYKLASDSPCRDPGDSGFHCDWWMGWVAGTADDGSPWLTPNPEACPSGPLDVSTYLGMTALHRLSCFGGAAWTLRAYMAPVGGDRGGTSIFSTEPGWLDAWGTVIFPQLEERVDDGSSDLFMYAHPDLGCDFGGRNAGCAFAPFVGQWIQIQGHLDDAAAATCTPVYNPLWVDTLDEPLPPLPDVAASVLRCRSVFVATDVQAAPQPN